MEIKEGLNEVNMSSSQIKSSRQEQIQDLLLTWEEVQRLVVPMMDFGQ